MATFYQYFWVGNSIPLLWALVFLAFVKLLNAQTMFKLISRIYRFVEVKADRLFIFGSEHELKKGSLCGRDSEDESVCRRCCPYSFCPSMQSKLLFCLVSIGSSQRSQ